MLESLGSGKACGYNPPSVASAFPAQQIANQSSPLPERRWWREWRFFLFLGLALLPCFWQSRIQAGDLSSHLYNAWLALQIRSGAVHGLSIVPQWTNVAFDWLLTWLLATFGAGPAQRIAVSLAVLVFVGGAFAFISATASRRPWFLTPCIAMLAYGFVFHIGFFNFYLSLGICLWFLAVFWNGSTRRRALGTLLLVPGWLSHPLPVIWAVGAAAYLVVARLIPERRRPLLLAASIGAVFALQQILFALYHTSWSPLQALSATGADQALVYGSKYAIVMAGLLLLWLAWLRRRLQEGGGRLVQQVPAQLLVLTAAGVALIPSRIDFSQYGHALVYIGDRMSLVAGVLLLVVLAEVRVRREEKVALAVLSAIFFAFLYADGAWANRQENQVEALVQKQVPVGARAVFLSPVKTLRIDPLGHVMDRACIGRCFSYANYEASTRQFRIRAAQNNGIVVTSYKDSYQLASGDYVVQQQDVPLYQVEACQTGGQEYCVRELRAGKVNGHGGK
ncbi:MAG TPA: hypothetical protein VGR48_19765 [Terriglobales bacterium]|nr:hypothetical protein [Terriglobales bacterium]